jgi:hypothetical protein
MIVSFEREIKDLLSREEDELTKELMTSFGPPVKDIKDVFPSILNKIGKILFDAAAVFAKWHVDDINGFEFSFFPGYIANNNLKRIFCEVPFKYSEDEKSKKVVVSLEDNSKKIVTDFWYNKNGSNIGLEDGSIIKNISFLSIAYHFLFRGNKNDNADFDVVVGGTHQWVSKVSDEIALNDALDPLELLAFLSDKRDARKCQILYPTWASIPYDPFDKIFDPLHNDCVDEKISIRLQNLIYEWCESVVNKLDYPSSGKYKTDVSVKWPYNPGCEIDTDKFSKIKLKRIILLYRAYIVAFWMQFNFNPKLFNPAHNKDRLVFNAWFNYTDFFIDKFENEMNLRDSKLFAYRNQRINELKQILLNSDNLEFFHMPEYKAWYTIPFKHRLNFTASSQLNDYKTAISNTESDRKESKKEDKPRFQSMKVGTGSAMILTNILLDKEYFRFIIPWLERVYDALREYDTAQGAQDEALDQFSKSLKQKMDETNIELTDELKARILEAIEDTSKEFSVDKEEFGFEPEVNC